MLPRPWPRDTNFPQAIRHFVPAPPFAHFCRRKIIEKHLDIGMMRILLKEKEIDRRSTFPRPSTLSPPRPRDALQQAIRQNILETAFLGH